MCDCTHIVELLLRPVAASALQTVNQIQQKRNTESGKKPVLLNSCHAFSISSPIENASGQTLMNLYKAPKMK